MAGMSGYVGLAEPCPGAFHVGKKVHFDETGCETCRKRVGPAEPMSEEEVVEWLST